MQWLAARQRLCQWAMIANYHLVAEVRYRNYISISEAYIITASPLLKVTLKNSSFSFLITIHIYKQVADSSDLSAYLITHYEM